MKILPFLLIACMASTVLADTQTWRCVSEAGDLRLEYKDNGWVPQLTSPEVRKSYEFDVTQKGDLWTVKLISENSEPPELPHTCVKNMNVMTCSSFVGVFRFDADMTVYTSMMDMFYLHPGHERNEGEAIVLEQGTCKRS